MPFQRHPVAERRRPITVVLVDDEQLIRTALGQMLIAGGVELDGEAANGEEAIGLVLDLRPDVVVIDIRLPGRACTRSSGSGCSPPCHAYWSSPAQRRTASSKRSSPAPAATRSQDRPSRGDHQRRQSDRGECVLSPRSQGSCSNASAKPTSPSLQPAKTPPAPSAPPLTERELEIVSQLARGKNNHEIARELSLSTNTIHNHIASILAKLHLENRIQAAVQAVHSGIS